MFDFQYDYQSIIYLHNYRVKVNLSKKTVALTLYNFMISTKLKKHAQTNNLMIEFSSLSTNRVIQAFYSNCIEEKVLTRRTPTLRSNQLNFHSVQIKENVETQSSLLKNVPKDFSFVITIFYLTSQQDQSQITTQKPLQRTLLIRQGLDSRFFMEYEFENTQSENESLVSLCQLSAQIINSRFSQEINFYDQSTSQIKSKKQQQNPSVKLWTNILYQIPGLGQDKCLAVSQKYPNYISILQDFYGTKQLHNVIVKRGLKQSRLGQILANRIYKCLLGRQYDECVLEKKEIRQT